MMSDLIRRAPKLAPYRLVLLASAALLALVALGPRPSPVRALPPAGTDTLNASGQATVSSRLGRETINLSGTVTIQRGSPHLDGGVEVVDAEITAMSLTGSSLVGSTAVSESPTLASTGEIRSLQPSPQFPASSFFDVYVRVSVPASPSPTVVLSNTTAIRMTPTANLTEWPPSLVKYASAPLEGVDNDGDALIDEDSSDEDGDHLFDEDPPGGGNQDTDARLDEDPPRSQCPAAIQGTPTLCDPDGDGLIDEDPWCTPLFPSMKSGACIVSISLTVAAPAPDTDQDGCTDPEELGSNPALGGQRDPNNFWDFFDVPTGPTYTKDKSVAVTDIFAVVSRFGSHDQSKTAPINRNTDPLSTPPPAPAYHPGYDRTMKGPNLWNTGPPDGSVAVDDIVRSVAQFGHSCAAAP